MEKDQKDTEEKRCYVCGIELSDDAIYPICEKCEEKGWFMDPIGTIHSPESDPSEAYR